MGSVQGWKGLSRVAQRDDECVLERHGAGAEGEAGHRRAASRIRQDACAVQMYPNVRGPALVIPPTVNRNMV